ncbi:MAG: DegT/DnrJ/EryC1/StrS family aminotransferase [Candidatus Omnitrophota bacterium]|nr:DegT/DnrJ/EryC1/StrS family aminotransferase [Candidatus Omnitrophota bacterium]
MPGFELVGKEERQAVLDIFDKYGGILFKHGFDGMRNGSFKVQEFQKVFAKKFGSGYAQAVTSGSVALKVALQALGIRPGDEVITQSFTFVATVEAIMECGAVPVITEVNETLTMDPEDLKRRITQKTKAVIPVHMYGASCNMDKIMKIAKDAGLKVLEDSAQAIGGKYKGKLLGSIGDAGAFSFDFGKAVTCGEGGMIITDDKEIYQKAMEFADHGHQCNPNFPRGEDTRRQAGFNYRMMELQGALGIVQLAKLDYAISQQKKNKAEIMAGIKNVKGLKFRSFNDAEGETADTLTFTVESVEKAKKFVEKLKEKKVGTKNLPDAFNWHFSGTWDHLLSGLDPYKGKDLTGLWPRSYDHLRRTIALPINIKMSGEQIDRIVGSVKEIAKEVL